MPKHSLPFVVSLAVTFTLLIQTHASPLTIRELGDRIEIAGAQYTAAFSTEDGHLLMVAGGDVSGHSSTTPVVTGGDLWEIEFADHTRLSASRFLADGGVFSRSVENVSPKPLLTLRYQSPELDLIIRVRFEPDCFELTSEILHVSHTVVRLFLPARLGFPSDDVNRVIFPQSGLRSYGLAFSKKFYGRHDAQKVSKKPIQIGGAPYEEVFGSAPHILPNLADPAPLTVSAAGTAWFTPEQQAEIARMSLRINRPSKRNQIDFSLIDSPSGSALSGARFGGSGYLMRFSGRTEEPDAPRLRQIVSWTIEAMIRNSPDTFTARKIAVIHPDRAPRLGHWSAIPIADWRRILAGIPGVAENKIQTVELRTEDEIRSALATGTPSHDTAGRFALVLNPYGSWLPFGDSEGWRDAVRSIKNYVRSGGIWWETGGYPWHWVLEPEYYTSYQFDYPAAVSDFFHLDSRNGALAVFGVQPVPREPWKTDSILIPAFFKTGGSPEGGYFQHAWFQWITAGGRASFPPLRIVPGENDRAAIDRYRKTLDYPLALTDKVPSGKLQSLKEAVLVRLWAPTARDHERLMALLPRGSIVHIHEYMRAGRDRELPDHFPVRKSWGTNAEFRALIDRAHATGYLFSPYVNTTFWTVEPHGETYRKVGNAPLLKLPSGAYNLEAYSGLKGYTVTPWHPEAIKANRRVRDAFVKDFPVDLLFQDQIGARGWLWDMNPASPTPTAYYTGLHSLGLEDSRHVPIATEDGNDRTAAFETMHCGLSWGMIPSDGERGKKHNRYHFHEGDWEYYPLYGYVAHDQALVTPHNLGHFTDDFGKQSVAIAFGIGMNAGADEAFLKTPSKRAWLYWIDAVQKTVAVGYGGAKLLDFGYPLSPTTGEGNEVIAARYPDLLVVANTGPRPVPVASLSKGAFPELKPFAAATIAGHGFLAVGETIRAGVVQTAGSGGREAPVGVALSKRENRWSGRVYSEPGTRVDLSAFAITGHPSFVWHEAMTGEAVVSPRVENGVITLPEIVPHPVTPIPPELAALAPVDWRGRSRSIIVPLFDGAPTEHVATMPAARWVNALRASATLRENGFTIETISEPRELEALLSSPPDRRPFAIVNPGGAYYYAPSTEKAHDMLRLIKDYVAGGGIWWEAGGYPFEFCAAPDASGQWSRRVIAGAGPAVFGFNCANDLYEEPPNRVRVTEEGRRWFSPEVAAELSSLEAGSQRNMKGVPNVIRLLTGGPTGTDGILEAVRTDGWGWLWRLTGVNTSERVSRLAVTGVLEHLATAVWPQPEPLFYSQIWDVEEMR